MNSKLVSLFCCLIMLVSFSGCTKVTQLVKDNQPTKAELLAELLSAAKYDEETLLNTPTTV